MDEELQKEYNRLYGKYVAMVYSIAYEKLRNHHAVQDVVQDTFMELYRTEHILLNEGHVKGWLIRVCTCKVIDYIRKERAQRCDYVEDFEQLEDAGVIPSYNNVEEWLRDLTEQEVLEFAWERLYERDKRKYAMLIEATYSDRTTADLAGEFEMSENSFSKALSRIRKFMAKTMDVWNSQQMNRKQEPDEKKEEKPVYSTPKEKRRESSSSVKSESSEKKKQMP